MPSEPNISAAKGTANTQVRCSGDINYEKIASIQSLFIVGKSIGYYRTALERFRIVAESEEGEGILSRINTRDPVGTCLSRLWSVEAMQILNGIYIHSKYVTDDERMLLGLPSLNNGSNAKEPTRNSIKAALLHDLKFSASEESCRICASRIVDAAIVYGFVKSTGYGRPNLKPVLGTERLHELICAAGRPCAELYLNGDSDKS